MRNDENEDLNYQAALDKIHQGICASKIPYVSREAAGVGCSVMKSIIPGSRFKCYVCSICGFWHVGAKASGAKRRYLRKQHTRKFDTRRKKKW